MKVLITGGAGYIGYSLVNKLEQEKEVDEIIVYDNLTHHNGNFFFYGPKLQKTKIVKADILNSFELDKNLKGVHCVVHLAGEVRSPYSHEDYSKYEQINQYGTLNLYQSLLQNPVEKVIYLSSAAVYGFHTIENENGATSPENAYGKSKYEGEKYLQNLKQTELYILRSANVYGGNPCIRRDAVINKFAMDALLYKRILLHGDGSQIRPFIYLPLVIRDIMSCINGSTSEGIYNLVEKNASTNEIRDILMEVVESLEFTYVSAHAAFQSLEMYSDKIEYSGDFSTHVKQTYKDLKKQYRL